MQAYQPFVEKSGGGEGIGQEFKRTEDGNVGQAVRMPGFAATQAGPVACANGIGNVTRRCDEKDVHVGKAASEFGADKLVAPPDVIPVFEGKEEQKKLRELGAFQ